MLNKRKDLTSILYRSFFNKNFDYFTYFRKNNLQHQPAQFVEKYWVKNEIEFL